MERMLVFLLKSIVISGLLTILYCLLLRNKNFHQYNRFFLLFSIAASLIVPFFHFDWYTVPQSKSHFVNSILHVVSGTTYNNFSMASYRILFLVVLVAGVSSFLLLNLFRSIQRLYTIKRHHAITQMKDYHFIETHLSEAPFSFFNNLFWRTDIPLNDENGKKILMHELTHIRDKHSYDKLFSQVTACIFWMNPFFWFFQKELNVIHEFIADAKSIGIGDTDSFSKMLLRSHNKGMYLQPVHRFFHSPVERRLAMIGNIGKTKYGYARKFFILPFLVMILMIFSFSVATQQTRISTTTVAKEQMKKKLEDEKNAAERSAIKINLK